MLSIAHGSVGALITSKIPNPIISVPLALLSHYMLDYVPHWDVGQGLTKQKKSKKTAFLQELLIDLPLSAIIVFLFFQAGKPLNIAAWTGWFLGLLPDFLEFPYLFLNARFTPFKQLAAFHTWWHRSTPNIIRGTLPQILTIILVYILR